MKYAAIVASKVRDRLEVGLEAAQQPDDPDIALSSLLQPPARSNPVQIAVDVELQEIAGRIALPTARRLRLDPREPGVRKIEPVNEGVDEPHRILGLDVIVNRLRQQQKLVPSESGNGVGGDLNVANAAKESAQAGFRTVCKSSARDDFDFL